jgi:choline dehydrogenase-like flavoprotein
MIIDARTLSENETVKTDVCIVGAGTAGITLAREFMHQKFRVCLLESGGSEPDKDTQLLYWGENTGHPYYPLDTARARYFGGSSNLWRIAIGDNGLGARMRPLDEIDFEERDWVPYSGWPFAKSHLEPYYERAQAICKIEPPTYAVEDWEDPEKTPRLSLVGERVKTVIFKFGSRSHFIKDYPEEIRRADNITTYLNANVTDIETNETAQTVARLRVVCLQGSRFWISAKVFILAAGGIETPRLLLISNKTQSTGLGNQNDLVGRFFMEHLHFWSGIYRPSNPDIFSKTGLYDRIHTVNGVPIIGKLSLSDKVLREKKMANHCIELIPRVVLNSSLCRFIYPRIKSESVTSFNTVRSAIRNGHFPDDFGKHLSCMVTGMDGVTAAAYRKFRRKLCGLFDKRRIRVLRLAHMTEQVPNPNSRVTLIEDRDNLGLNRVRLNWQLSPIDILSAIKAQEILDEDLRRAGLGRLYIEMSNEKPPANLHGGYHHMGTTRMHVDPKKGVVDANCNVHNTSNLFIAGPSVFPTGGYANPILTIVALGVRLADHVKNLMK